MKIKTRNIRKRIWVSNDREIVSFDSWASDDTANKIGCIKKLEKTSTAKCFKTLCVKLFVRVPTPPKNELAAARFFVYFEGIGVNGMDYLFICRFDVCKKGNENITSQPIWLITFADTFLECMCAYSMCCVCVSITNDKWTTHENTYKHYSLSISNRKIKYLHSRTLCSNR